MSNKNFIGYSWHIEKTKGTSKTRKTCFNCIHYCIDDHSCNKKGIPITNNNAKYCNDFVNGNDGSEIKEYRYIPQRNFINKEDLERYNKIIQKNEKIKEEKRKEKAKRRIELTSEEKRERRKNKKKNKNEKSMIQEYHRKLNSIKKLKKAYEEYGSKYDIQKLDEEKEKIINEFKMNHKNLYLKDAGRKIKKEKK